MKKNAAFRKCNRQDVAAIILGAAFLVCFLFAARYGIGIPDEPYYISVAQRFLHGDRIFVDEWHLTQLSYLLLTVPYALFRAVTGGTAGIVLFFRYWFLLIDALFYAYAYVRLRRYGWCGLLAALSYYVMFTGGLMAFNYHSLACMACMLACLLLFLPKKNGETGRPAAAGVSMACAVLAQPFLTAAFAVYFAAVLLYGAVLKNSPRVRKYGFVLQGRVFFRFVLGILCVFVPFVLLLWSTGTFSALPGVLPHLFTGREYSAASMLGAEKLRTAVGLFGAGNCAGLMLCAAAAAVYRFRRKKSPWLRLTLVFAVGVLYALSCVAFGLRLLRGASADSFILYHFLPTMPASLALCLLCDEPRPVSLLLCLSGWLFALCADTASRVLLAAGGQLCAAAALLSLHTLLPCMRQDLAALKTKDAPRRALRIGGIAVTAVCVLCVAAWHGAFVYMECASLYTENALLPDKEAVSAKLQSGPYAGIRTTESIREICESTLADLDTLRQDGKTPRVLILGKTPYMYLYLQLPMATYSAWYEDEPDRLLAYWTLLPENRPDYIYVPFFNYNFTFIPNNRSMADFITQRLTDYRVIRGSAGYFIEVTGDFLPDE